MVMLSAAGGSGRGRPGAGAAPSDTPTFRRISKRARSGKPWATPRLPSSSGVGVQEEVGSDETGRMVLLHQGISLQCAPPYEMGPRCPTVVFPPSRSTLQDARLQEAAVTLGDG